MMFSQNQRLDRSQIRRNRNLSGFSTARATTMGPVSTALILVVIVGVLALLYLTQITKTSVYGIQVSSLNNQREELLARKQELEVEAARLQAIARIRDSKVVGSLEAERNPRYINQN